MISYYRTVVSGRSGDRRHIVASQQHWVNGHKPVFCDNIPLSNIAHIKVAQLIRPNQQGWDFNKINMLFDRISARHIKGIKLYSNLNMQDT